MTSALGSLGALKAEREAIAEAERNRNKPRAGWFTPPKDGTAVKIQFLNELDPSKQNFNPQFGTYLIALEHQAPGPRGFLSRALDTMERDGHDWAQEQHIKNPKAGWKAHKFFYINVAVEETDENGNVVVVPKILQRKVSNQFVADLIEEDELSGDKGITGQTYLIKRVGEGTNTQWRLRKVDEPMNLEGVVPWDLQEHAVRYVPYEKQEEFYMRNATLPDNAGGGSSVGSFGGGGGARPGQSAQSAPAAKSDDWGW